MNRVWIICLMLLCFGSVTLLETANASGKKDAVEKVEKKSARAIKAPAAKVVKKSPKRPDRFIDRNNNGVNDQQKPKVVKPRLIPRTKAASKPAPKPEPRKKEKTPPR